MANTQAMCTSFMGELLTGTHNFTPSTGDTFKAALYLTSSPGGNQSAATTAYGTTGEVSGAGYTAGGVAVTNANAPTATERPNGPNALAESSVHAVDRSCVALHRRRSHR